MKATILLVLPALASAVASQGPFPYRTACDYFDVCAPLSCAPPCPDNFVWSELIIPYGSAGSSSQGTLAWGEPLDPATGPSEITFIGSPSGQEFTIGEEFLVGEVTFVNTPVNRFISTAGWAVSVFSPANPIDFPPYTQIFNWCLINTPNLTGDPFEDSDAYFLSLGGLGVLVPENAERTVSVYGVIDFASPALTAST